MRFRFSSLPVALLLVSCLTLGACERNSSKLSKKSQETLKTVKEESEAAKAEARRQLDEQGYYEPDLDMVTRASEKLAEAAESATGEEKIALQTSSRFNFEIRDIAAAYQNAMNAFIETGGLDLTTIQTEDDAAIRLDRLADWQQAANAMETFLETLESAYLQAMVDGGASRGTAEATASVFVNSMNLETAIAIRKSDNRYMAAIRDLLEVLEAHIGLFEFDDEGDLLFAESVSDEAFERYSLAFEQYQTEMDLQVRLTRLLLGD